VRPRSAYCRAALLGAAATLLCSCTLLGAPPAAADYQANITALSRIDANSPAALDSRLEYADFLIDQDPDPCGQRLDLAQSQLDIVARNPATQVVFPRGWARTAGLEYRIHRGRAQCKATPSVRARELRSAIEATQRAVALYRDAFDYSSMAVAQFNVAATYQELGQTADAIAALEAAIQMDREFGLRDDAQDNYQSLLTWMKQPADAAQVAQRMSDFPSRSITLKFAWSSSDATVTIDDTHAKLVDGTVLHAQVSRRFERRIRFQTDGWVVYQAASGPAPEFGVWPRESQGGDGPLGVFAPSLVRIPAFQLTPAGDFAGVEGVTDLDTFAATLAADAQAQIRAQAPAGSRVPRLMAQAVQATKTVFAPDVIEDEVAENYELETAMWIGATLQQGMHYQLVAPLELQGVRNVFIDHSLDFTFTREVPCPGDVSKRCAELIVRATPLEEELQQAFARLSSSATQPLRYASSTALRIVVDPQTLKPYLRDTQRYWYATLGKDVPSGVVLESERSVVESVYRYVAP
jgi:tetratricopeptide (TPR) repeat protein